MILKLLTRRSVQVVLMLLLLGAAVFVQLREPEVLRRLQNISFDRLNAAYPRPPGDHTLIVDIDEESLRRIGQWPWPHTVIGDLAVNLRKMGAKAVVFDMTFGEADRTSPATVAKNLPRTPDMAPVAKALEQMPDNDQVFAQKISQAGNVVMGFVGANAPTQNLPQVNQELFTWQPLEYIEGQRYYVPSLHVLEAAAAGNGAFTAAPESDGVIRSVQLLLGHQKADGAYDLVYPSLALEALRVTMPPGSRYNVHANYGQIDHISIQPPRGVKGPAYVIETDDNARIRVYYAGHDKNAGLYVPAWQVLAGQVPAGRVQDKIVFIGTSAIGLLDIRASPLDSSLPGVEIHSEIIEQALSGKYLLRGSGEKGFEIVATVVIGLFLIFLAPFISAGILALLVAGLVAASWYGSAYAYTAAGSLFDPLYPSLVIVAVFILSSILTNLRTELEKRQIRLAFGHYISPVLIEELAKNPEKLKLGGEVRELTVMFTDIRNFTSISETMDPAELIRMMNDFLTPMTSAVLDNRGTVDKYMGDAMMTFWNAPLDDALHARNACKASLEMVRALAPVNEELRARAAKANRKFIELRAGIGIHSGKASVGNMGSKQRFAYSALGDTVNLASRMEGQTKAYGIAIMMSHTTHAQVTEMAAIEIDLLAVKGRAEAERVYTLLGDAAEAKTEAFRGFAKCHDEMLAAYRAQNWDRAKALGEECANLRPDLAALYQLYLGRIEAYRLHPPPADWTGVWVAKEK